MMANGKWQMFAAQAMLVAGQTTAIWSISLHLSFPMYKTQETETGWRNAAIPWINEWTCMNMYNYHLSTYEPMRELREENSKQLTTHANHTMTSCWQFLPVSASHEDCYASIDVSLIAYKANCPKYPDIMPNIIVWFVCIISLYNVVYSTFSSGFIFCLRHIQHESVFALSGNFHSNDAKRNFVELPFWVRGSVMLHTYVVGIKSNLSWCAHGLDPGKGQEWSRNEEAGRGSYQGKRWRLIWLYNVESGLKCLKGQKHPKARSWEVFERLESTQDYVKTMWRLCESYSTSWVSHSLQRHGTVVHTSSDKLSNLEFHRTSRTNLRPSSAPQVVVQHRPLRSLRSTSKHHVPRATHFLFVLKMQLWQHNLGPSWSAVQTFSSQAPQIVKSAKCPSNHPSFKWNRIMFIFIDLDGNPQHCLNMFELFPHQREKYQI